MYGPKDFLEVLVNVTMPGKNDDSSKYDSGIYIYVYVYVYVYVYFQLIIATICDET